MQNRTLSTFIVVRIHARICVSFIVIWSFYAIFADAHFDYLMTKFMKILNYIFKFDPWLPCCMTFTGLDNLIMWSYDSNSTFRPSKMVKLILFLESISRPFPNFDQSKIFEFVGITCSYEGANSTNGSILDSQIERLSLQLSIVMPLQGCETWLYIFDMTSKSLLKKGLLLWQKLANDS